LGLTNFPQGISSFGLPVYGTMQPNGTPLTATVLFVDTVNGVDAGSGNSPTAPYQTLTYALTQIPTTGLGTYATIYIMQGSTITISSATSLLLNVANVAIVGLGVGAQRPTFNFTTANTASIPVSVAGVSITNCRFTANFLSIAKAFTLTTAAGFGLYNNIFIDSSSVLNFLSIVGSTGAANTVDRLTAIGNTWNGLGTTSVTSFIVTANDIDSCTLQQNNIKLARTATAAILMTVTAGVLTNLLATGNNCISQQTADTGGAFINVGGTTSTGLVGFNVLGDLSTTDLFMTTTVGVTFQQNYKTGVITASGYLLPAADS
jgi:hypothetical protein